MRPSGLHCVIKHMAKAYILSSEVPFYPKYKYLIIGNLSEAVDECGQWPELQNKLHEELNNFLDAFVKGGEYKIPFELIFDQLLPQ